jgi:hypothetical protein
MSTFEITVKDYASPALADELAKEIADELAHADPQNPVPAETVDALESLAAQAAASATLHKLVGPGHIEIVQSEHGWQVQLFAGEGDAAHAIAQALDPARMTARADERKAKADAAARELSRKKAHPPLPQKAAPGPKTAAGAAKTAAQGTTAAAAAARPTIPPPRRA